MTNEQKLRRAKELAARKAFEAYAAEMEAQIQTLGVTEGNIGGTTHVHDALLVNETGATMFVRCTWEFSTHPAVVAAALAKHGAEGQG